MPADRSGASSRSSRVQKEEFQKIYTRAIAALKAGNFQAARTHFAAVVEQAPRFAQAHRLLGLVYVELGDPVQAIRYLEMAVQLGPRNAQTHYVLGTLWSQTKDLESAEKAYLEAIKIDPGIAAVYQDLGILYYRMGKTADSANVLLKALSLKEDSVKTMLALGMAYVKLGQPENAMEYVTSLRSYHDEAKAIHLESLIRGAGQSEQMKEPGASNLIPGSLSQITPEPHRKSQGKVSLSGRTAINLRGRANA